MEDFKNFVEEGFEKWWKEEHRFMSNEYKILAEAAFKKGIEVGMQKAVEIAQLMASSLFGKDAFK